MLASSLTESDDRDKDDEEEVEVRERQPTPDCPNQLPFPATEKNVPKLKAWLIKEFGNSSFNILSAPLAKMLGPPMKIHIYPDTVRTIAQTLLGRLLRGSLPAISRFFQVKEEFLMDRKDWEILADKLNRKAKTG